MRPGHCYKERNDIRFRQSACLKEGLEIRFPCHPQRPTVGYEQLANAWKGYFRDVQELRSTVATALNGNEAWSEWHWWGKRDDADWDVRGVIVWTVEQDKIIAGRNYMEPVEG